MLLLIQQLQLQLQYYYNAVSLLLVFLLTALKGSRCRRRAWRSRDGSNEVAVWRCLLPVEHIDSSRQSSSRCEQPRVRRRPSSDAGRHLRQRCSAGPPRTAPPRRRPTQSTTSIVSSSSPTSDLQPSNPSSPMPWFAVRMRQWRSVRCSFRGCSDRLRRHHRAWLASTFTLGTDCNMNLWRRGSTSGPYTDLLHVCVQYQPSPAVQYISVPAQRSWTCI